MEYVYALIGITLGLITVIGIIAIILPIFASQDILVNQPEGLKKSGVHFFTKLAPGQIKIIVRGKKIVRMITNTSNSRFARNGTKDDPSYWELVSGQGTEDPTSDISWPFRLWSKIVYWATGAVFTGIYPFQRVYEYELERTNVNRSEAGEQQTSNIVLTVKRDLSDHLRSRQFLFPMHITAAETRDKIPLDIIGVAEMEVSNPHKAAFGTDRWDQAVINLVTDMLTATTKSLTLDEALTAKSPVSARKISRAIERITDDTEICGIKINAFRILEINPALDTEGLRAIQAEAIALQQAKATRIDADARADAIRALNKANKEGGEHALASLETEAFVRATKAASEGGGTVILTPSGGSRSNIDPTLASILVELKKINEK